MTDSELAELKQRLDSAESELAEAEQARIPAAALAGILAYATWHSWLVSVVVVLSVLIVVSYYFSNARDRALGEYQRAAGSRDEPIEPTDR